MHCNAIRIKKSGFLVCVKYDMYENVDDPKEVSMTAFLIEGENDN